MDVDERVWRREACGVSSIWHAMVWNELQKKGREWTPMVAVGWRGDGPASTSHIHVLGARLMEIEWHAARLSSPPGGGELGQLSVNPARGLIMFVKLIPAPPVTQLPKRKCLKPC